mmetsp:Transcript_4449/g.10779  ORF Transcript_4449/g.10779 Transcript_4449/m.10779 type:complete len:146 (-) Transcript_4449:43-480(-)
MVGIGAARIASAAAAAAAASAVSAVSSKCIERVAIRNEGTRNNQGIIGSLSIDSHEFDRRHHHYRMNQDHQLLLVAGQQQSTECALFVQCSQQSPINVKYFYGRQVNLRSTSSSGSSQSINQINIQNDAKESRGLMIVKIPASFD